ncbi:MAG: hypothetical protein ACRDJC_03685 [Thermomicrobiales bacterium]
MNGNAFDAFTRQAADAISRRTSLLTIGGATLATVVGAPKLATAKKGGNKAKKKCKKQVNKCKNGVQTFCADFSPPKDEEACNEILSECCEFFKNCNAKQGTECLLFEVFTVPPDM